MAELASQMSSELHGAVISNLLRPPLCDSLSYRLITAFVAYLESRATDGSIEVFIAGVDDVQAGRHIVGHGITTRFIRDGLGNAGICGT